MAHYALINSDNIVTSVIVGRDESDTSQDWEEYYTSLTGQTCKRTSYNTREGNHLYDGTPFRKNYAGIGYTFDSEKDAFIPEKPFPSWTLNDSTCSWDCPVSYPTDIEDADGNPIFYIWNEEDQQWDLVS